MSLPRIPPLMDRSGPLTAELLLEPGRFGLGMVPPGMTADGVAQSVCGFCSTGCGLRVLLREGEAIGLTPAPRYPVNSGMACPKGWEALAVLDAPDRASVPLLRDASGKREPIAWNAALATFARRMKAIQQRHGPESIAFLSTGQIVTEEMALLGALAKFGMGMTHGDGNTRQCMASAVVAYKQSFGFDAPPYSYADLEQSDVIVLVGANPCIAHPILWQRVMRNPHRPQIVVIDPRATETAMAATQHMALAPKSDLSLLYGVARLLLERDWIDRRFIDAHTEGFDAFAEFVQEYTLERVAEDSRLAPREIERLAATIHAGERVSFWWTMGVNQSHQAVRTAQAIINLALMTGNIGRVGTGANSITGQCNAMGSRLFSNTTNLLGGHDFANPSDRRKVADILDIPESRIPTAVGRPYHQILEGILRREIRGLWVIATNPAHSWINQGTARDILRRLDFLVVQDMYHGGMGRKIGDVHQFRAADRIGFQGASRPRTGPGRFSDLQVDRRCLGLRRYVPTLDIARSGVSDFEAAERGPAVRFQRHPGLRHARSRRGSPMALSPRRRVRDRAAAVRRRAVLSREWPGAVRLRSAAPAARTADRKVPLSAADRPWLGGRLAYQDANAEFRGTAQADRRRGVRRGQSGRRGAAGHSLGRLRLRRLATR